MEELFIPYKQALDLKELGFDEECLQYVWKSTGPSKESKLKDLTDDDYIGLPIYSQAFKFFRDEYKLEPEILSDMMGYACYIVDRDRPLKSSLKPSNLFQYYEEGELACLIELIKRVKLRK